MRNLIILVISLVILIGSGLIQLNYLNNSSQYLISDVEYIENLINNNDFKEANNHYDKLHNTWENMSNVWCIFIHNNETETLKEYMVELEKNIELENKNNVYLGCSQIINKLENIVEKQKLLIENVF